MLAAGKELADKPNEPGDCDQRRLQVVADRVHELLHLPVLALELPIRSHEILFELLLLGDITRESVVADACA